MGILRVVNSSLLNVCIYLNYSRDEIHVDDTCSE